jgi:hypothetical protein
MGFGRAILTQMYLVSSSKESGSRTTGGSFVATRA